MIDLMRIKEIFDRLGSLGNDYNSPMDFRTPPFVPQQTFGGGFQDFQPPNPQPQQQPFQPTMTMQDKFMELIQGFPQRDANPSGWRKIGALLTGLGGENAGEAMNLSNTALNLPFINKVQDWGMQVKPTMEAAENERLYNQYQETQNLNLRRQDEIERKNAEAQRLAAEKLEEEKRQALSREDVARRSVAVREAYQTMRARRDANTHRFFVDKDGMVIGVNVLDPSKITRTGIDSKELSETQKMDLELEDAIALENVRSKNRITEKTTPGAPTTHITTGGSGGANELEVQRRVENRKRRMMIERKDLYDWIDPNTGTYKRNTPPNIQQEITDYIYGEKEPAGLSGVKLGGGTGTNQPPPQQRPANRPAPPPVSSAPRVRTDGKVFVWDNETGQYGYVLRDAVTKAKTADGKMRFEVIR